MTVEEIKGTVLGRVADPSKLEETPLLAEMNAAHRELIQAIRDADTELCDNVQRFDLQAGLNTYPPPKDFDSIRKVERFDLSGIAIREPVAVPCTPVPYAVIDRSYRLGRPAYVIVPSGIPGAGNIVLVPIPSLDLTDGLRITTLPVAEKLVANEQTPRVPEPLHDVLAGFTLRRCGSLHGVNLSDGAPDWIKSMYTFLVTYLNPSGRAAVTRFIPAVSFYGGKRP